MENDKPVDAEPVGALVPVPKTNAAVQRGVGVLFTSVAEVWSVADNLRKGGAGPKGATTASIAAAIIRGQAAGLDLVTAMSQITVVNGRASLMGDLALALVRKSGLLASYKREWIGTEGADDYGCRITAKRKDTNEEADYTFTFGEAKRAGLCRTAMWTGFTKRMVYYRTLGFILRDLFSDVLMGLYVTEELLNERQIEAGAQAIHTTAEVVTDAAPAPVVDPLFAEAPAPAPEPPKALTEGTPAPEIEAELVLDPSAVSVVEPVPAGANLSATEIMARSANADVTMRTLFDTRAQEIRADLQTVAPAVEALVADLKGTENEVDVGSLFDQVAGTLAEQEKIARGLGASGIPNAPDDPFRGFREPEVKSPPARENRRSKPPAPKAKPAPPAGGRKW